MIIASRAHVVRALLLVSCATLGGCWPGRCDGAFRMMLPRAETDDGVVEVNADGVFTINSDSRQDRTPAQLLSDSKLTSSALFLEGPKGLVPLEITGHVAESAHSCASAASFDVRPQTRLVPGPHTLVLLLDVAAWPATFSSDVQRYQGHPALVRRYLVR